MFAERNFRLCFNRNFDTIFDPVLPEPNRIFGLLNLSIDRFQVSHFRPVVMEIEIGGRSEKSLGGQESAAVDQECM